MTVIIFDVAYSDTDKTARVGALQAKSIVEETPSKTISILVNDVAPYEPGQFFKRELPCIMAGLAHFDSKDALLVIDGFVSLDQGRPGLGMHLHEVTGLPVIGIAKTSFKGAQLAPVLRGTSKKPLYVQAVGLPFGEANDDVLRSVVQSMHGANRIPTLCTYADHLARGHRQS